jgi:hypothetical protein
MADPKKMTLMAAARDYFGMREGQTTALEFAAEYRKLTDDDKDEIRAGLEKAGYMIINAPGVK